MSKQTNEMTQTESEKLGELRQEIDSLDKQIHELLNNRAIVAGKVAEVKQKYQDHPVFYRPEREAQVLKKVMERNEGPISDETMAKFFRGIMSICLDLEAPQVIAYLGPAGTFTHSAALKHFGKAATTRSLATINDVFREVEAETAMYGVVPVENSSEGAVNHTLDGFVSSGLKIIGEVEIPIHQNFLVAEHTKIEKLSKIYSHQMSLAQCRKWLDINFPNVEKVAVSSNAEAASRLKHEWHSAAIAGDVAAAEYGLHKLHANIEDNPNNTTRFLVIGREPIAASGDDKTSILVTASDNQSGVLFDILAPFKKYNISLTSIETRPERPNKWSYVFFIDLEGHVEDENVVKALTEVAKIAKELRVLGSYPKAVI